MLVTLIISELMPLAWHAVHISLTKGPHLIMIKVATLSTNVGQLHRGISLQVIRLHLEQIKTQEQAHLALGTAIHCLLQGPITGQW